MGQVCAQDVRMGDPRAASVLLRSRCSHHPRPSPLQALPCIKQEAVKVQGRAQNSDRKRNFGLRGALEYQAQR